MDIIQLIQNFITFFQDPNAFIKIALILLLLLFLLFTITLARQISHLIDLVDQVAFSPVFKGIAYGLSLITLLLLTAVIFV